LATPLHSADFRYSNTRACDYNDAFNSFSVDGELKMSMADRDGLIWYDGKMVPWREATTHVLTHTLHYGMGVFEGVRAYKTDKGTAIFRLKEHTDRLFRSAHILGMKMPFDKATVVEAQKAAVRENNLESAYMRPMAFYGAEAMGISAKTLSTHLIVAAWKWGAYMGEEALERGIRVKTSSFSRHHVNITMCKAKANGNYMNSILAHQEAAADGYDEALLLDVDGFVAEGSGENIFIVRNGKIYTPDLTSALEGITRDTIVQLAAELGYTVIEKRITRDEVYSADEAFFTGTAAEVTPIRELDNRAIGLGKRGPVTEQLQKMYFDVVTGKSAKHMDWLTIV
jgi:branched-chain amino acid aminotransferase